MPLRASDRSRGAVVTAKKGCLIAGVGVVVLAAVVVALVFWLTGGAVQSADDFLGLLAKGETERAYQSASAQFKAQTDSKQFQAFAQQMGLNRYASSTWTSRSVENDQAKLEGSIETSDGGTVPLTISLVKEDGAWKILSISGPAAGVSTTDGGKPLPSDDQSKALAARTLSDFKLAVDSGDYTAFYGSVSNLWKSQTSPDALRDSFRTLEGLDLGAAAGDPVFSEAPSIDGDGLLRLNGYAVASGSPNLNFKLKYIYEHPNWKLFGIDVKVGRPPGAEENPPPSEPAESSPGGSEPESAARSAPASPGDAYVIQDNPELRGRLGRLVVSFPADSKTNGAKIEAFRPGESSPAASSYGAMAADLLPGRYDVVVSGQRVPGVEVVSAKDTRLLVGVLRVQAGSGTKIVIHGQPAADGSAAPITSAYGETDFGLPVGSYGVEIAGQTESVAVEDGKIVEF